MAQNFQIQEFLRQIAEENSKHFRIVFQEIFFLSLFNKRLSKFG